MENKHEGDPLVLVVDDNKDASTILSKLLQIKGYRIHVCHSGEDGYLTAKKLRPAVALLDLEMPGMDGYQLCRLIRAQSWGADMLIVALSGHSGADDQQLSLNAGFEAHMTKPVDFAKLFEMLRERLFSS